MFPRTLPLALLASVCLAWAGEAAAQTPWRSALYPQEWQPPGPTVSFDSAKLIQDFSYAGYRAGEAEIPHVAGPIYDATLAPYLADKTGVNDATNAIQSAINAAQSAGGGVVWLPAGTYRVRPQGANSFALRINASGIVLRGAGVGQTFLFNDETSMRSKSVILVQGSSSAGFFSSGAGSTTIATDLVGPATVIPVASVASFAVGQTVMVRNTINDAWITEHNEADWLGQGGSLTGFAYARRIVAIDATAKTLTLDAPTRYSLKTRDNARVIRLSTAPISEIGLEDFSIGNAQRSGTGWGEEDYSDSANASYYTHDSFLIRVQRTRDAWVRRVASFQPAGNTTTCHLLSNGLQLLESRRVTLEATHFQRPQFGGGGGNGYMYRLQHANDCLLVDCRATFSRHGFVFSHFGSCGNVFHACTDKDTGRQTGDTGSQSTSGSGSDHHMHFSHSNLIDTCTGENSWFEARYRPYGSPPLHNLTAAHTVFWNTRGLGSSGGAVVRTEQSRYGYAIGTRGTRTSITRPTFGGAKCDPADHVEGAGLGDTLEPFSLYEDQRIRRLGIPEVTLPAAVLLAFPHNSVTLAPTTLLVGRQPATAAQVAAQWRSLAGPAPVHFTAATSLETAATFTRPGTYQIELAVTANGRAAAASIEVTVAGNPNRAVLALPSVADTYVRSGTGAAETHGASTTLLIKDDGGANVTRRAFLRFDLAPLAGRSVTAARLELFSPSPPTSAATRTAEAVFVSSDSWDEATMNWNTQPAAGAVLGTWPVAQTGADAVDVLSGAQSEVAGDGVFSLSLRVTAQPSGEIFGYGSKEGAVEDRPRLVAEYALAALNFTAWIAGYPSLPAADRLAEADPDDDGLTNFSEYFLALNPTQADATGSLTAVRTDTGLELRFLVSSYVTSTVFPIIEATDALGAMPWQPVPGVVFETQPAAGDALLIRAHVPESFADPRRFFRLRISGS